MRMLLYFVVTTTLLACQPTETVTNTHSDTTTHGTADGQDGQRPVTCGDGVCDLGETNLNCDSDCEALCGDGVCDLDEDTVVCPIDCLTWCGDGACNGDEHYSVCAVDCDEDRTAPIDPQDPTPPEDNPPAADCSGCLNGAASCEEYCQNEGYPAGYCGAPGSMNPDVCCVCDDPAVPPAPTTSCGDGDCNGDENSDNCAADCDVACGDPPHYKVVGGQCLPSCGVLINASGWSDGTCCQNGCADASQDGNSTWDCPSCCPGPDSCVDSNPTDPPEPPPTTGCGDGSCAPGEEDCGMCPDDCPCPTGTACKNNQCVDPDVEPGCVLGGEYNDAIEDSVYESAVYVKDHHPEFFDIEDWDSHAKRKQAYKMMTTVINHLRAKCVNASRCVANPGLPQSDPFLWCSDALVIGTPGNGTTVDIYQSWSAPAHPQTHVTEEGGQTGVVTADLIPLP